MYELKRSDKSWLKCFSCHGTRNFMRDCLERSDNDDSVQIVVVLYEDIHESVDALVVWS